MTGEQMAVALAKTQGWTEIEPYSSDRPGHLRGRIVGVSPSGRGKLPIPRPDQDDGDAFRLMVWLANQSVEPSYCEKRDDTLESIRLALCTAACAALGIEEETP